MSKIVLKEANEADAYWLSSPLEKAEYEKFLKGYKDGKVHKHSYVNSRGTTMIIDGDKDGNVYTYPEDDPDNKRRLTHCEAPKHKGRPKLDRSKSKSNKSTTKGGRTTTRSRSRSRSRSRRRRT